MYWMALWSCLVTCLRADRDSIASGKSKGGGIIIIYVNQRWCNPGHLTTKSITFSSNLELLAVSIRPYSIPREFSLVIVVCVYFPPRAEAEAAWGSIYNIITALQTQHLKAPIIVSSDFNHVTLDSTLFTNMYFVPQ